MNLKFGFFEPHVRNRVFALLIIVLLIFPFQACGAARGNGLKITRKVALPLMITGQPMFEVHYMVTQMVKDACVTPDAMLPSSESPPRIAHGVSGVMVLVNSRSVVNGEVRIQWSFNGQRMPDWDSSYFASGIRLGPYDVATSFPPGSIVDCKNVPVSRGKYALEIYLKDVLKETGFFEIY